MRTLPQRIPHSNQAREKKKRNHSIHSLFPTLSWMIPATLKGKEWPSKVTVLSESKKLQIKNKIQSKWISTTKAIIHAVSENSWVSAACWVKIGDVLVDKLRNLRLLASVGEGPYKINIKHNIWYVSLRRLEQHTSKLSSTRQEYAKSTSREALLLHPQLLSLDDLQIIADNWEGTGGYNIKSPTLNVLSSLCFILLSKQQTPLSL